MRMNKKPSGVLRWFLRLPIWLYRMRLGWLMGNRFLLLQHTGRKTGLARYAVVEVIRYDKTTGTYTIASGWGTRSDWFRNIQKTPEVRITTARGEMPAIARWLPPEQGAAELADYAQRHPQAFRILTRTLLGDEVTLQRAEMADIAEKLPVVRLETNHTAE